MSSYPSRSRGCALLQIACVAVVALSVNAPSWAAAPNVVGTWKLVSSVTDVTSGVIFI